MEARGTRRPVLLFVQPFHLYIHLPFCRERCPYCDFYVEVAARGEKAVNQRRRLIEWLEKEAHLAADECRGAAETERSKLATLYLGGGTPSLLTPEELSPLFTVLRDRFEWAPAVEVTLEANPATTLPENLAGYRELGINRLSLGVQTFDSAGLKLLGRGHSPDDARRAITAARAAGFERISGDLIYGWPGQTLDQLRADFDILTDELGLNHLSTYSLTIHEGTAFGRRQAEGRLTLPPDERVIEMLQHLRSWSRACGLPPYEIGNMARPAEESRHNTAYWTFKPMIPLGPSACGYLKGRRLANPCSLETWSAALESDRLAWEWEEPLEGRARWAEYLLCGLRRTIGVNLATANDDLGVDLREVYQAEIAAMKEKGWIETTPDSIRLSEEGVIWADSVAESFF